MASKTLKLTTVIWALILVVATELMAWIVFRAYAPPAMLVMGIARCVQIAGLLCIVKTAQGGLDAIGLSRTTLRLGLLQGAFWSGAFGAAAALGMAIIHLSGRNPLLLLRSPLPVDSTGLIGLFLVGGLLAPLAEEMCFRGLLYGFFRRWGVFPALIASTAIFTALHSVSGLPVTQIVGGLVFAIAYERSRNLVVPIVIHLLGNTALFALSLPLFR
jgi:membrane protease YdiL (CAAX protease family)